jgi:branched-chain amino acid transport system substrate-binding protein
LRGIVRRTPVGIAAISLLAAAACGGSSGGSSAGASGSPGTSTAGTILVGYDGDLSGPFAISGQGAIKGIQAYFAAANKAGGIAGKQVKLITLDDGGDPNRALSNVQQLLTQDKVQAMLGFTISGLCEAAGPTLERAKVPVVCTAAGPKQVSPPSPSKWVFQAQLNQDHMVGPVVDLIKATVKLPNPKVAYIYYNSASHIGFADAFEPALKTLNWPLVQKQVVPLVANPPVAALATKIAASKPDVVVSFMVDSTAKLFYSTLRAQGYKGPIIQNPDTGPGVIAAVKDPSLYVLTHQYMENTASDKIAGDENYQKMVDVLKASGVDPGTSYVPRGYLNAITMATALQSCNACSGQQLADALLAETVPTNGITAGDLSFSADDHSGAKAIPSYYWHDGTVQLFMDNLKGSLTPN